MPQFEIIREEEEDSSGGGWAFLVQVLDDEGTLRRHRVRLSWADYNHWSAGGADAPARVAEAAIAFIASIQSATEIAESFDASIARRLSREADEAIPRMIRDGGAQ